MFFLNFPFQLHLLLKHLEILAIPHLVGQMLFARKETVQDLVHVYLNTLETLTPDVDQNVSQIQIVTVVGHVLIINA